MPDAPSPDESIDVLAAPILYNVINPSDPYTIATFDHDVAAVACFCLGEGAYAFEPVDPETPSLRVPIFLFDSADPWCQSTFGKTTAELLADVVAHKRLALIACLDSLLIGSVADRHQFNRDTAGLSDAERARIKASHHVQRCTSLNDVGARAALLVRQLQAMPGNEAA